MHAWLDQYIGEVVYETVRPTSYFKLGPPLPRSDKIIASPEYTP
jgi:hypothetical protein